jgi:hypothetical protein
LIINITYFVNYLRKKITLFVDNHQLIKKLYKAIIVVIALCTIFFSWTIILGYLLFRWYYLGNQNNYLRLRKYFKKILWLSCLLFFVVGFAILISFYFYKWYFLDFKDYQNKTTENEVNYSQSKENIIKVEF